MREVELVVFDMAGTTVEDRGQVPEAFAAALADVGVSATDEQLRAVRGASKRQALLSLLPEGPDRARHAERAYRIFVQHLVQRYAQGVHAISGAAEAFRSLRDQGVRVALNTGFDREVTQRLLEALGWSEGTVDAVVCGDDVSQGRPAPYLIFRAMEATGAQSVHRVAAIGDTVLDLQAGYHAGVRWNVGVLSGAHGREQLQQQSHTHLLGSVAEIQNLWPDG